MVTSKRKMVLSVGRDAKTVKGQKLGFLTGILYLAPSDISGRDVCPNAINAGCREACLYTAGRGAMSNVQAARIAKTDRFFDDSENFMADLFWSITKVVNKAKKENLTPTIRLNGTSDIDWQSQKIDGKNLFELFPDCQFYDYTKQPRKSKFSNYHLTFSYSSVSTYTKTVNKALRLKLNIAVVFLNGLPATYLGLPVVNGDESDLRFLDNEKIEGQIVIGLYAKGKAKKDKTGFVIDTNMINIKLVA